MFATEEDTTNDTFILPIVESNFENIEKKI